MDEDGLFDLVSRWPLATDRNGETESLGVDISDIDTTFVSEKDFVTFTSRVDADVEFGVGRMGEERLDDEGAEGTGNSLDLHQETELQKCKMRNDGERVDSRQ